MNLPNSLTIARIFLVPVLVSVLLTKFEGRLVMGLPVELVKKVLEGRPHIVDAMKNGDVQLVFNTTEGKQSLQDSFAIRRSALMSKIPYFTTAAGALAAAQAIVAVAEAPLEVRPLQSYGVH